MQKTVRLLALLLAAWVAAPTLAERQRPLAQVPAENADAARVIVAYRAGAALARLHPVRTGESRSVVATAYQRRADDIGQRAGVVLRAGRAVGDRAHVVTASGIGSKAGGRDYLLQFLIPVNVTENTMRRGFAPPAKGKKASS